MELFIYNLYKIYLCYPLINVYSLNTDELNLKSRLNNFDVTLFDVIDENVNDSKIRKRHRRVSGM